MFVALTLVSGAFAATLQVDDGGSARYSTIQAALANASDGDTIEVAPGEYDEVDFLGLDVTVIATGDASATVITDGVTFEGGEGSGAVLSGFTVRGAPAIAIAGASPTLSDLIIEDGVGTYGGLVAMSSGQPTITDSVLQDGEASQGGALYIAGGRLTLERCTVTDNDADEGGGAAVVTGSGRLTLVDTDMLDNRTDGDGGAVWLGPDASLFVSGGRFEGNYGYNGGAIYADGSVVDLSDTEFVENSGYFGGAIHGISYVSLTGDGVSFTDNDSYDDGGAIFLMSGFDLDFVDAVFEGNLTTYGYGGGVFASTTGSLDFTDVTFRENVAYSVGGGLYAAYLSGTVTIDGGVFEENTSTWGNGGGAYFYYLTHAVFSDVDFIRNRAYSYGGGVYQAAYGSLTIERGIFDHNSVDVYAGGGMYVVPYHSYSDVLTVTDSVFTDNTAVSEGGAIYARSVTMLTLLDTDFESNRSEGMSSFGGALYATDPKVVEARRSRFVNNDARYGGAVYISDFLESYETQTWTNNLFENNRAAVGGAMCQVESYRVDGTLIQNNSFVGNQATEDGGVLCLYEGYVDFRNNLVTDTPSGASVHAFDLNSRAYSTFAYNDWYENSDGDASGEVTNKEVHGRGTMLDDPGLAWGSSWVPAPDSPLRDAGDPNILDRDGSVSDIGATGGPEALAEDRDGDGYDSTTDCDDDNEEAHPDAIEQWYDGVNQDCGAGSDFDRDGDGYDASEYGGDDCDDESPDVLPEDCGEDTGTTGTTGADDTGGPDTTDPGDGGTDGSTSGDDTGEPDEAVGGNKYPPPAEDTKGCATVGVSPSGAGWLLVLFLGVIARRERETRS